LDCGGIGAEVDAPGIKRRRVTSREGVKESREKSGSAVEVQ